MIEALKDPAAWISKRKTALEGLIEELSPIYYDSIEKYKKFYPIDEATELANRDIKSIYEMRIRQLEIDQPGASLLFQGAVLENNLNKAYGTSLVNNLGNPSKKQFKKYYKERRARYKAKKHKSTEAK
jgi:hypothetical protein